VGLDQRQATIEGMSLQVIDGPANATCTSSQGGNFWVPFLPENGQQLQQLSAQINLHRGMNLRILRICEL